MRRIVTGGIMPSGHGRRLWGRKDRVAMRTWCDGRGKWTKADLRAALEAKERAALGFNAPPDGLYFAEAYYPGER